MKKLLLITGDIAAGKSTFSKILSARYRVAAFQKDSIKEILGDAIGFHNREENLKLSNATMGSDRMNNENRHPVHLSTTLDVKEDFVRCAEWMKQEKIIGHTIEIDATDFSYQKDEELLKRIDVFMG